MLVKLRRLLLSPLCRNMVMVILTLWVFYAVRNLTRNDCDGENSSSAACNVDHRMQREQKPPRWHQGGNNIKAAQGYVEVHDIQIHRGDDGDRDTDQARPLTAHVRGDEKGGVEAAYDDVGQVYDRSKEQSVEGKGERVDSYDGDLNADGEAINRGSEFESDADRPDEVADGHKTSDERTRAKVDEDIEQNAVSEKQVNGADDNYQKNDYDHEAEDDHDTDDDHEHDNDHESNNDVDADGNVDNDYDHEAEGDHNADDNINDDYDHEGEVDHNGDDNVDSDDYDYEAEDDHKADDNVNNDYDHEGEDDHNADDNVDNDNDFDSEAEDDQDAGDNTEVHDNPEYEEGHEVNGNREADYYHGPDNHDTDYKREDEVDNYNLVEDTHHAVDDTMHEGDDTDTELAAKVNHEDNGHEANDGHQGDDDNEVDADHIDDIDHEDGDHGADEGHQVDDDNEHYVDRKANDDTDAESTNNGDEGDGGDENREREDDSETEHKPNHLESVTKLSNDSNSKLKKDEIITTAQQDHGHIGPRPETSLINETTPVLVIVMAQWRFGSSIIGELFNQNHEFFYLFEPMAIVEEMVQLWRIPGPFTPETYYYSTRILQDFAKCNFSDKFMDVVNLTNHWGGRICNRVICEQTPLQHAKYRCLIPDDKWFTDTCLKYGGRLAAKVIRGDIGMIKPLILEDKLNVKIIYLVRDPRGSMASRLNYMYTWDKDKRAGKNMSKSGRLEPLGLLSLEKQPRDSVVGMCKWMRENTMSPEQLPDWLKGRYHLVRFEDFANEPMRVTEQLYEFVGLDLPRHVRDWVVRNTNAARSGQGTFNVTKNSTEVAMRWMKDLSEIEIAQVESNCLDVIDMLGYKPFSTLTPGR